MLTNHTTKRHLKNTTAHFITVSEINKTETKEKQFQISALVYNSVIMQRL